MEELTNLLLGVIIVGYVFNYIYKNMKMDSVKSTIDNREYKVRKLDDRQKAADKLAIISKRLHDLVEHVYKNYKTREGVNQLKTNFKSNNIIENTPGGKYTAYSVNKGEQLALCLRDINTNEFIDLNLIIFVSIHELSHVMTDEIGHTPKFWDNMKFLLKEASNIGIYTIENYDINPKMYCGMEINSTPLKI